MGAAVNVTLILAHFVYQHYESVTPRMTSHLYILWGEDRKKP